jgi:hypothetical protein
MKFRIRILARSQFTKISIFTTGVFAIFGRMSDRSLDEFRHVNVL